MSTNNIDDINKISNLNIHSNQKNEDNNNNNNNEISKINTQTPSDKINEIEFNDDDDNFVDVTNIGTNNFIAALIDDLDGGNNNCKKDISILEEDYLEPKKYNFINKEDFIKILNNNFSKNDLSELKKSIDKINLYGRNVSPLSTSNDYIEKVYKNNKYNNSIKNSENSLFRWRGLKTDNESFYKSVIFYYLENLILNKNEQEYLIFLYDVYLLLKHENYFNIILKHYKIEKSIFLNILVLIFYALSIKNINDSIEKSYTILIKAFNNYPDFLYGIIIYLKYSIFKYLKENEGKLYSKNFSVNIDNLLPEFYQKNEKILYQQFYEKELLPLNKPIEKIIIYITPFILNKNIKIYSFNLQNTNDNINEIYLNLNEKNNNKILNYDETITLSLVNNQYEIVYSKDYILKFQNFFQIFSNIIYLKKNNNNLNNDKRNSATNFPLGNNYQN